MIVIIEVATKLANDRQMNGSPFNSST